nr:transposon [uncultured archaeon]
MFDESYKLMKTFEFQTTKEGINELMKNVPEGSTVVIEAGTTGKTLSRMLSEKYVVHMIAPLRRPEIKTDERDSINIVKEDALGYVSRCYIPSPYVEGLRFLSSNMIETGQKAAMVKNQIHALIEKNMLQSEFEDIADMFGFEGLERLAKLPHDQKVEALCKAVIWNTISLICYMA